jgi:membrane protein implicated in regulation of membrane protease activity
VGVSPAIKYTLARLGLFVVVLALLWFVPNLDLLIKLMIAVLVSAIASWFLLKRMRDDVATQVESSIERRRQQKEELRGALAGDDKPSTGNASPTTDGATKD